MKKEFFIIKFTTVADAVEKIVKDYTENSDVTFGEYIAGVSVESASVEDVVNIYEEAMKAIDGKFCVQLNNMTEVKFALNKDTAISVDGYNVSEFPPEVGISIEKNGVIFQDICLVRAVNESEDTLECLVWADGDDEDYTHKFSINLHKEKD